MERKLAPTLAFAGWLFLLYAVSLATCQGSEDDIIVLEGRRRNIFVPTGVSKPTGVTQNNFMTWQAIDPVEGDLLEVYLQRLTSWNVNDKWTPDSDVDRLGYLNPRGTVSSPYDNEGWAWISYRSQSNTERIRTVALDPNGKIRWACFPTLGRFSKQCPKQYVGVFTSLNKCAEQAFAQFVDPAPTGVERDSWENDKSNCYAYFGAPEGFVPATDWNGPAACYFQYNVLPGYPTGNAFTSLSTTNSINECGALAEQQGPQINGMSWNVNTKECRAIIAMSGNLAITTKVGDMSDWRTAIVWTRNRPTTTTTTITTTTTPTTTTTTPTTTTTTPTTTTTTPTTTTTTPTTTTTTISSTTATTTSTSTTYFTSSTIRPTSSSTTTASTTGASAATPGHRQVGVIVGAAVGGILAFTSIAAMVGLAYSSYQKRQTNFNDTDFMFEEVESPAFEQDSRDVIATSHFYNV